MLNGVKAYINDHFSLKLSLEQLARIAHGNDKAKKVIQASAWFHRKTVLPLYVMESVKKLAFIRL